MARNMVTLLLISLAFSASAAGRASAGVKAGLLLSLAENDEKSSIYNMPTAKLGPKTGIFFRLNLANAIALQPELQFALKGTHYYSASVRHTRSVHFYYLEIPLTVNAMIIPKTLEIFAGPYGAALLGYSPADKGDWTWEENELKRTDLGGCAGVRFWRRALSLELQCSLGFIDILPSYQRGHHNLTVSLQFGYLLFR